MADKIDPLAMELPAPFINQFQVLSTEGNVRISFAEGFSDTPPFYRSAVVMSARDARALALAIVSNAVSVELASRKDASSDNSFLSAFAAQLGKASQTLGERDRSGG